MLDYKLLEALAAVVQEEGFDKAATTLHLTQSAISHRIRTLEEQTGQTLLIRGAPPRPTPAGQKVLKHFRMVQSLESDLEDVFLLRPRDGFISLVLGINADSLATWFLPAIRPFLDREHVLLDLLVKDQDITHQLLANGDVIGCISSKAEPPAGCTAHPLGVMTYRLMATPDFMATWFPNGLTREAATRAPAVIFNRRDGLHHAMLCSLFPEFSHAFPAHYIPSSEQFVRVIMQGHGYGLIPDLQMKKLREADSLAECAPGKAMPIPLFWHTWSRQSDLLARFTSALVQGGADVLEPMT
ncbi:LysR family transcriptional regulator ArgP [Desulfoplanes formicivorans]|uniref:Chromosome replication initiation inhibitor protein n=1 Tax=Desulfoplanes formicivorans TaxID=1592317 RepID=A0A194AE93_9BACT|nr:LysR family transcriptional regulator ArgP [Desulfoplanes formicivorans]GAU08402.1 chromosome replication initiation inhibitor protein [Desulfoplanes formicivorans]